MGWRGNKYHLNLVLLLIAIFLSAPNLNAQLEQERYLNEDPAHAEDTEAWRKASDGIEFGEPQQRKEEQQKRVTVRTRLLEVRSEVVSFLAELESGVTVHNPMRVVPNGEGSEFIFTLFRRPDMSDEQFAEDGRAVETDLRTLKELLERPGGGPAA